MMMEKKMMTEQDVLAYGKKMNTVGLQSEHEAQEATRKLVALLEQFGYTYHRSFNSTIVHDNRYKKPEPRPDTSWFYRKVTSEHGYMEVQVGWCKPKRTVEGIFRVTDNTDPDLHPDGRPWKIGDTRTVEGGRIAVLTRYGWNTGD
jgi:hypothetical protein